MAKMPEMTSISVHAFYWRWLRASRGNTLQSCLVTTTAHPYHQPTSAATDPSTGVFKICEECYVACNRDLIH